MDQPQLDALADRLRWKCRHDDFAAVAPISVAEERAVDAPLLVQVTLGDIDYERDLACYAGTERYCAWRRRTLAARVSRLLSLTP